LRPPDFLRISTSDFSGVVFVMSLKSAIVMYRVDGVSGLNVLTGIIAKVLSATLKSAGHHSCSCWKQLSVCKHAVLPAFRAKGTGKISNAHRRASSFLKNFRSVKMGISLKTGQKLLK